MNGRVRKVLLYAVVIYSAITFVIGIPTFLMVSFPISKTRFPCIVKLQVLNRATGNERTPQV